jgi:polyphenol oxidase
MGFVEDQGLRSYQFELFEGCALSHGIFTRQGGVSPAPWASLNLGGTVGDERAHVIENRRRLFDFAGKPVESVFDVWQVHGTQVICSRAPRPLDSPHEQADAILTDQPHLTLLMRFADCVPILVTDPVHKVVGIIHAGWKGTLARIASAAVQGMGEEYGSNPADILAGIGPSICKDEYEVGPEVAQKAAQSFPESLGQVLEQRDRHFYLDLWAANRNILEESGLLPGHIQVSGICTARNLQDWYSHRGEKGKTGRFGALISLKA